MREKPGYSQFWSGLMKVKDIFYKFCRRTVNSGRSTCFWEDTWHNNMPLMEAFPRLYDISFDKNIRVDKVVRSNGACLVFRRCLWGNLADHWRQLCDIIESVQLNEVEDRVFWKLG